MRNVLLVIAAGDAKRMNYSPKAVSIVNGVPNLANTYEKAKNVFDDIFVISNETFSNLYKKVVPDAKVLEIVSGRGCGDAVMKGLDEFFNYDKYNKDIPYSLTFCWGDVYIPNSGIFTEILFKREEFHEKSLIIPCYYEADPYVWFRNLPNNLLLSANFKKRGEVKDMGWHDMSIFNIRTQVVYNALLTMSKVLERNDKYVNGEMIFLDVVSYLRNIENHAMMYEINPDYKTIGYNTETELEELNRLIS